MNFKARHLVMGILILIIILTFTTPSEEKFEQWLHKEYGIHCEYNMTMGSVCSMNGEPIDFRSSAIQHTPIYQSFKVNYETEQGESITIRALGVLGFFIKMNED